MDKFDELLKQLNECGATCDGSDVLECLPQDVYDQHFNDSTNYKVLAKRLDVDKHRWYETSMTVIAIYGRILGARHATDIFSENMSFSDFGFDPCFFEMEAVPSVDYKIKE